MSKKCKTVSLHLVTKFADKTYSEEAYARMVRIPLFLCLDVKTKACLKILCASILEKAIRIPMNDEHVRSLNVSNTVCMIVYEALRQQQF